MMKFLKAPVVAALLCIAAAAPSRANTVNFGGAPCSSGCSFDYILDVTSSSGLTITADITPQAVGNSFSGTLDGSTITFTEDTSNPSFDNFSASWPTTLAVGLYTLDLSGLGLSVGGNFTFNGTAVPATPLPGSLVLLLSALSLAGAAYWLKGRKEPATRLAAA